MLVSELVFRILMDIAPDRTPADSGSMPTWQFYVNGSRRSGEAWALHQHAFGGMGGRPGADGLGAVSFPYNVRNVSVEWSESETPVLFEQRELIPISGGAGQWRGGLGEELVITAPIERGAAPDQPLLLSGSAGRMRNPAQGLLGGAPGSLAAIEIGGAALEATASPAAAIEPGQRLRFLLPGGGGYGNASERDPALIERDLRNGYISAERARRDYGWSK